MDIEKSEMIDIQCVKIRFNYKESLTANEIEVFARDQRSHCAHKACPLRQLDNRIVQSIVRYKYVNNIDN